MINLSSIIIKTISKNSVNLFSTTSTYTGGYTGFSQRVYQKLSITRLPNQTFTLFIDLNDNVSNLFNHLEKLFHGSNFIATNKFTNMLGRQVTQQDLKLNEQIKNLQLFQLLMHSNLMIYEQSPLDNKLSLALGVEIKEYHETNNRNLPEHIAKNIIELAQQWRTDRSVQTALSKVQTYNEQEHQIYIKQRQQLIAQTRQAYVNYLDLYKFYQRQFIDSGKAKSLVANLVALMSANWVFLFGVTYGKYGWDVGEPLSYLTNLGVELIAMMGIFKNWQTGFLDYFAKNEFGKFAQDEIVYYISCQEESLKL